MTTGRANREHAPGGRSLECSGNAARQDGRATDGAQDGVAPHCPSTSQAIPASPHSQPAMRTARFMCASLGRARHAEVPACSGGRARPPPSKNGVVEGRLRGATTTRHRERCATAAPASQSSLRSGRRQNCCHAPCCRLGTAAFRKDSSLPLSDSGQARSWPRQAW